jgi:hypothetical protein
MAKKIKPDEWYSLQDIVRNKMFPWAGSFWSVRNTVTSDRKGQNLLNANIQGEGRATKYHFKGANIIKFIEAFEAGTASA